MNKIYLAGGCFWGVEAYFKQLKGVLDTKVGYANGNKENPTYEEVCSGLYHFSEAIEIIYTNEVRLETILEHFFRIINPFSLNKQGGDIGIQYRTGIYYETLETKEIALKFIEKKQSESSQKIVVEVEPLVNFYDAEKYHQDYLTKNPNGYCHIDLGLLKDEEKK
ncbi:Peptide methionine sulfoxide reductase MsrA [Alteracholeplasma palmae J233]|uniref:Peptide methionine sulfoxide reductase MsrA n=1 Tax=Alteracholeplasma palmae (strain ATCC 49389 / J233) TaxID=1318466 RepID=U4KRY0_ALTPJ|nr:peptide-methionine (S)-S-oxide reductase MsrA [Alteracholeplasma palmae]CCV64541.1 Peptide methionine sulfoxide reductase MsrA [Alteracholeplasma palmae J233]